MMMNFKKNQNNAVCSMDCKNCPHGASQPNPMDDPMFEKSIAMLHNWLMLEAIREDHPKERIVMVILPGAGGELLTEDGSRDIFEDVYDEMEADLVADGELLLHYDIIFVIVYGRMVEIYLMVSLAPIPFATFGNHEQSHTGQNYLRSLFALGFQGFLNPIALKADFILSLCELIVGGKEGLQPVEKTVIDRCVHQIYQTYFENPVPENMPVLQDLYEALLRQDEKEAHHVATALEIYVTGSLNLFNHRTNVDINNRLVCYDIKELGKQLKKIGMLVVQDQVWGRVTANRNAGKATRYYMDEFHLLLKEEQTAAYSVEIWKRFRKWGGIPTGITQNVKDLLSSREVTNIFENSDFIYMLNQAAGDRQILADQLNISPHQLSYVTHSGEGEGLLFYGNVILPFVDRFPTDLELYRIMTTKLTEVQEAKEA